MTMAWERLPTKARLLFHLQALARFVFFWVPTTGALGFTGVLMATSQWSMDWSASVMWSLGLGIGWLLILLILALWMPSLAWQRWAWMVRERDLLIVHGVIVKEVTAIPLSRIQHVDTRQGILEQWFGLARLSIYTASGMGADGFIPGLTSEMADALRDRLVRDDGDDGV